MFECFASTYVYAWCPQRSEEVSDAQDWRYRVCELTYGYWELKPGPHQEQQGLLMAEPTLEPTHLLFEKCSKPAPSTEGSMK